MDVKRDEPESILGQRTGAWKGQEFSVYGTDSHGKIDYYDVDGWGRLVPLSGSGWVI